jgi:CheY-like chemotaxis protein
LAAIVSGADRLPAPLRGAALPALWIAGILLAWLLVSSLTGLAWLGVMVSVGGMVLAAWQSVKILTATRDALDRATQERAAMEQALHRSQKMAALGRFSVGAAHDFNNHLTVISSNVEMLSLRLDRTQDRLLRHAEAAMQAVQRAAGLTGRLLSLSRQSAPEPEAVGVDRLLSGLSDLLRRTLGARTGLDIVLSGASWHTWVDANQMESALLSLTVNAGDRIRDQARLTIMVTNVHQDERSETAYPSLQPGDYIQIAITESAEAAEPGNWGPADDLDSADLSMARGFARDAGGCLLRSDSTAGGLSLRLFLPRYTPPAASTAVAPRDPGGRAKILVVEDDAAVRDACVEMLRQLNYDVLEAPDAMEAFRLIADHGGIDLLLTDLGLPAGVSGHALADAARNVDAAIRVLFTTGRDQADLADRAGVPLLRKPFNQAQLAGVVRDVLAAPSPATQVNPLPLAQPSVTQPRHSAASLDR